MSIFIPTVTLSLTLYYTCSGITTHPLAGTRGLMHTSKVMLKILQARSRQCVSRELQVFKLDLERQRNQRSNHQPPLDHSKSKRVPGKHLLCFIDSAKAFDCVDHNKLQKILKEMGIPDHLTCLLRNLYAGQEATVKTWHGTTDWFQIGKEVRQDCI